MQTCVYNLENTKVENMKTRTVLTKAPVIIALLFAMNSLFAQSTKAKPINLAKQTTELREALNLNDEQYSKLVVINNDFAKKRNEIRQACKGDREAIRAKLTPLQKERNLKIVAMLTSEQKETYKNLKAEREKSSDKQS